MSAIYSSVASKDAKSGANLPFGWWRISDNYSNYHHVFCSRIFGGRTKYYISAAAVGCHRSRYIYDVSFKQIPDKNRAARGSLVVFTGAAAAEEAPAEEAAEEAPAEA